MDTGIDTVAVTSSGSDERPWRRRSRLWTYEAEIRRLQAEGFSLAQIIRQLRLGVSRSYLCRWLHRAAAARPAGEPALAAPPAAPSGAASAAADDAAAEALLALTNFAPSTGRSPR